MWLEICECDVTPSTLGQLSITGGEKLNSKRTKQYAKKIGVNHITMDESLHEPTGHGPRIPTGQGGSKTSISEMIIPHWESVKRNAVLN